MAFVRQARFVTRGYTPAQMFTVGQGLVTKAMLPRMRAGLTTEDTAAPPLTRRYAVFKARKAPPAIRNWTLTGRTLRSLQVLSSIENQAVIGFTDRETNKRAYINNARVKQFGVSKADSMVLSAEFAKQPPAVRAVAVTGGTIQVK